MEDPAIKALWNKISDLRVELKADAIDTATFRQRIVMLLEGDPVDKKNPGIISRLEELEAWKLKRLRWERNIRFWAAAVVTAGAAILGFLKAFKSIM